MAFSDDNLKIEPAGLIPANDPDRTALKAALATVHAAIPLSEFRHWIHPTNPNPFPGVTAYRSHFVEAAPGTRAWEEKVYYYASDPENLGPGRDFDAGASAFPNAAPFRKVEYLPMRVVRDVCDRLVGRGATNIRAQWS